MGNCHLAHRLILQTVVVNNSYVLLAGLFLWWSANLVWSAATCFCSSMLLICLRLLILLFCGGFFFSPSF